MTNEEKQALIEDCQREISHLTRCIKIYPDAPVLKRDLLRNEIALSALTAQPDDTRRMDWLVSKTVNVRQPLPYGSHNIFWSQQTSDDCDEQYATDLRDRIDSAISNEVQE